MEEEIKRKLIDVLDCLHVVLMQLKENTCRDERGRFCSGGGKVSGESLRGDTVHVSKTYIGQLKTSEQVAILKYTDNTTGFFRELNKKMRDCPEKLDCLDEDQHDTMKTLNAALSKAMKFDPPAELYRGISLSHQDHEELKARFRANVGRTTQFHGITSLTADKSIATSYSESEGSGKKSMIIKILAKSGAPIKAISVFPKEEEVIHGHGQQYKVNSVTDTLIELEQI